MGRVGVCDSGLPASVKTDTAADAIPALVDHVSQRSRAMPTTGRTATQIHNRQAKCRVRRRRLPPITQPYGSWLEGEQGCPAHLEFYTLSGQL
jgi:hypothetical protein